MVSGQGTTAETLVLTAGMAVTEKTGRLRLETTRLCLGGRGET